MFGLDFIKLPLAGTPFGTALEVCLVVAFVAWLLSVITREVSWIDRLWSICPPVYCLIVAFATDFQWARVNVMALLVVLWGARLTWNFARKGGYKPGGEDYRWAHVREKTGPVGFQVLNITFIHPAQMVLGWLFASPIHRAWALGDLPLNRLDFVAAGIFFLLLVGQTVADRQQWDFQQDKKRRIAAGEEVAQPFSRPGSSATAGTRTTSANSACGGCSTCSRSPHRASGCTGRGWAASDCPLLFIPSLRMTEQLSVAKYPAYRDYQATTSVLIPLPPRGG